MKLFNTQKLTFFAAFLVATLFTLQACDTTSNDHDDHSDPFGAALIMNGVEIAAQEGGAITYLDGDHLELEVGEETNLIQIRFIAEDGDRFTPDADDGFSLQWKVADESVLEVEQHEEDGPWSFHLVGTGVGETTVEFDLFHNDHSDFTTLPFDVHVEEVVSGMEVQDESGQSVVTVNDAGEVTGTFEVNAGETAGEFTAIFLDEDGAAIDTDHDYELEWHVEGTEIATVEAVEGSPFSFNIQGVSAGQTQVHFALIKAHEDDGGGDGHDHDGEIEVYESPDIIINVN